MAQFDVPIAFLVFNRPATTARVFDEIRRIKPLKLLVVADGPRNNITGEVEKCSLVRSILEKVDWPCEVLKNYAEINMGCKLRISSGLDWVFEQVEEAIILEDDCLPNQSFFYFCQQLLTYYRDDKRIMHIGGANFQRGKTRGDGSYYFSRLCHIWGWATWRRAWKNYDVSMSLFPHFCESECIGNIFPDNSMQKRCLQAFANVYLNRIDTWDYQWTFALYHQNGLSVIPNVNLVSNIGFGVDATHTRDAENLLADIPSSSMKQIVHPSFLVPDLTADKYTYMVTMRVLIRRLFLKYAKQLRFPLNWSFHG